MFAIFSATAFVLLRTHRDTSTEGISAVESAARIGHLRQRDKVYILPPGNPSCSDATIGQERTK